MPTEIKKARGQDGLRETHEQYTEMLLGLQDLRDIALYYSSKYKYDPLLGKTHEGYLLRINQLMSVL